MKTRACMQYFLEWSTQVEALSYAFLSIFGLTDTGRSGLDYRIKRIYFHFLFVNQHANKQVMPLFPHKMTKAKRKNTWDKIELEALNVRIDISCDTENLKLRQVNISNAALFLPSPLVASFACLASFRVRKEFPKSLF